MVKRRKQGHYCRICGEYKANEKFSGKGHAQHICKSCMSDKNKGFENNDDNSVIIIEDDEWNEMIVGDLSRYDYDLFDGDIDLMPTSESAHKKYGKLNKEEKTALKELWVEIVARYWNEELLIPFGEVYSQLKRELLEIFEEEVAVALKDDIDLKTVLNNTMIVTINKQLRLGHTRQ